MIIGDRLRLLREEKNLSQGDIEMRTGLLRSYLSRVENDHTIPSLETLEKIARALGMQLYQLLYDPEPPEFPKGDDVTRGRDTWGSAGKDARFLQKLRRCLSKMTPRDRQVLMAALCALVVDQFPVSAFTQTCGLLPGSSSLDRDSARIVKPSSTQLWGTPPSSLTGVVVMWPVM